MTTQVKVTHAVASVEVRVHVLCVSVESQPSRDLTRDDPGVAEDANVVGCIAVAQSPPVDLIHVEDVTTGLAWLLVDGVEMCGFMCVIITML